MKFLGYKVQKLEFENETKENIEINLNIDYNYDMTYSDDSFCFGQLDVDLIDKEKELPFNMRLKLIARFSYDKDEDRKSIHSQSFKELFPYVRMIITNLSTLGGLDALIIPEANIQEKDVKEKNSKTST